MRRCWLSGRRSAAQSGRSGRGRGHSEPVGLGAVYTDGIRNKPREVAAALGRPPLVFPLIGLAVGRPGPARPASVKPRLPQAAVLHRESYGRGPDQAKAAADYNETLRNFQREQGMAEINWPNRRPNERGPLNRRAAVTRCVRVLADLGFELQ